MEIGMYSQITYNTQWKICYEEAGTSKLLEQCAITLTEQNESLLKQPSRSLEKDSRRLLKEESLPKRVQGALKNKSHHAKYQLSSSFELYSPYTVFQ